LDDPWQLCFTNAERWHLDRYRCRRESDAFTMRRAYDKLDPAIRAIE